MLKAALAKAEKLAEEQKKALADAKKEIDELRKALEDARRKEGGISKAEAEKLNHQIEQLERDGDAPLCPSHPRNLIKIAREHHGKEREREEQVGAKIGYLWPVLIIAPREERERPQGPADRRARDPPHPQARRPQEL